MGVRVNVGSGLADREDGSEADEMRDDWNLDCSIRDGIFE